MIESEVLGKGGGKGGGHGRGHGGHRGHGHHRGGRGWGGGGRNWGGPLPFIYDVSDGIDVDDLLEAADIADQAQTKSLAREVVKQLKAGKAHVGGDLDLLDAEVVGEGFGDFGISSIFQTAGNIAQTGVDIWQKEEQKKQAAAAKAKSSAEERGRLASAISADAAAAQATARAAFAAQQKLPSAQVDASAAQQAQAAQARAASGLPPEASSQRIEAAEKALAAATAKAQAAPKDAYALTTMQAWQQILNKLQNAQITAASPAPEGGAGKGREDRAEGGGWLAGKTGPVPNMVIAGGGAVAAAGLLLKALLR